VSRILFDQKPLFGPPPRNAPFDQNVRCSLQRQSSGDDLLQNARRQKRQINNILDAAF